MIEPAPSARRSAAGERGRGRAPARPAPRRPAGAAGARGWPARARRPRSRRRHGRAARDAVPMPPLKPWQTMPVPTADRPFRDAARMRVGERLAKMIAGHVLTVDVVQEAVPRLADDRQRPGLTRAALAPLDRAQRVAHDADAVRVRDRDLARQETSLADPREPGQLAVAVQPMRAGERGIGPRRSRPRTHHRDSRAHRADADLERSVAADHRRMTHADALDVRDRVQRAGRPESDRQAEVA